MSQLMLSRHVVEPLLDIRRDFDRAFDHFFRHSAQHPQLAEPVLVSAPVIESWVDEADIQFHLTMPLPGLTPEEITIHLQGKTLILTAEHEDKAEGSGKTFLAREYSTQSLHRSIMLPDGVDGDKLSAKLSDGVLEITAPIAASALPKKIQINAESKAPATAKPEPKGKAA